MRAEALRLLGMSFAFALYLGLPVHGLLLPAAEAAITSSLGHGPQGTVRAEDDEGDTGSDDSGGEEEGEGSSEDDSD